VIVSAMAGCVVELSDSAQASAGGPAPSPGPGCTQPNNTGTPPALALDTGRTLSATPGDGAGIFVTYQSGGHWSLQWTCDTNASGQPCAFDVSVSASSINAYTALPANATVAQTAQSFRAQTNTTSTLDGATFDTPAGAPIVMSATINGCAMPNLTFYVSGAKLQTAPTDPVEFVPTDP
jgi:hypothetical protein